MLFEYDCVNLAASSEAEYRVPNFQHVEAFPSDKKWTHFKGVKHIVARADDGIFYDHVDPLKPILFRNHLWYWQ